MDAGNTALLIGIIVGLIGSVSVLVGVPIFLLNEEVNRVGDSIESLEDRMDTKIENRFASQAILIESRFAAQDARIESRFANQAALIGARFAAQDAKIEELRRGQSDIDRKLAVLITSLHQAGLVDTTPDDDIAR